jgi:hypothetical protein
MAKSLRLYRRERSLTNKSLVKRRPDVESQETLEEPMIEDVPPNKRGLRGYARLLPVSTLARGQHRR